MISRENFRVAIQGIVANRLRSLLTMLGVMIGVASVIILVAVGTGSSAAVQSQLKSLGTNLLTVQRSGGFGGGRNGGGRSQVGTQSRFSSLTMKDVTALRNPQNVPDAKSVNPVINAQSVTATFGSATYSPGQFVGTSNGYFEAANWQIASGRAFTQADETNRSRVIDLGQTVVTNLFGSHFQGNTVKVVTSRRLHRSGDRGRPGREGRHRRRGHHHFRERSADRDARRPHRGARERQDRAGREGRAPPCGREHGDGDRHRRRVPRWLAVGRRPPGSRSRRAASSSATAASSRSIAST